jgi:broad specificity phosphatase PhoE
MVHSIPAGLDKSSRTTAGCSLVESLRVFDMLLRYEKKRFMVEAKATITTAQRGEGENTRRLWLVRHGLTAWNTQQRFCGHTDIPLSARGRVQARWLARQLQNEAIATVFTSDLARARETAEIIASQRAQAVPVQVSAAWREMDFGAWEGLTYAAVAEQFKDQLGFFSDPEQCSPSGGESLAQVLQRIQDELAAITCSSGSPLEGDVVIVSHGGPLRILLCSILEMPFARQWQLRLDPGSLSAIDLLPTCELWAPRAILALLNVQGSTRAGQSANSPVTTRATRGTKAEAASEGVREEGTR